MENVSKTLCRITQAIYNLLLINYYEPSLTGQKHDIILISSLAVLVIILIVLAIFFAIKVRREKVNYIFFITDYKRET